MKLKLLTIMFAHKKLEAMLNFTGAIYVNMHIYIEK